MNDEISNQFLESLSLQTQGKVKFIFIGVKLTSNSKMGSTESKFEVEKVCKESKLVREFEVEKILGSGGFGVVLKAKNKFDTTSYAIKLVVQRPNSITDTATNEIKIFSKISSHQNVVSYKASWTDTIEKANLKKLVNDVSMGADEIERLQ